MFKNCIEKKNSNINLPSIGTMPSGDESLITTEMSCKHFKQIVDIFLIKSVQLFFKFKVL